MQTLVPLVSGDETEQEATLAVARNLLEAESGDIDDVAVVAKAGGIEAVTAGGDADETVRSLLDEGVAFTACANTLDAKSLDEADLVDGVETVPEGAVEATRLQAEGYAYLRP